MSETKTNLTLLICGLLALIIGLGVFNYTSHQKNIAVEEQLQHATYLYDQQVAIPKFNFIDQHGQSFSDTHIQDQWTLWFFGFTHCPDICPMTLATLTNSLNLIKKQQSIDDLKIVFISVDPQRDDPEQINRYVSGFHQNIIGASGYDEQLALFLKNMGIIATINKDENRPDAYQVDHSSALYLIAPNNAISAVFNTPHDAKKISQDIITIRKHFK